MAKTDSPGLTAHSLQMNNEIKGTQCVAGKMGGVNAGQGSQRIKPEGYFPNRVGMHRGGTTAVAGVKSLHQITDLTASTFANDEA